MSKWASIPRAAQEYGVSIPTMKNKVDSGEIRAVKFGPKGIRVSLDEIRKKLELKPKSPAKPKKGVENGEGEVDDLFRMGPKKSKRSGS